MQKRYDPRASLNLFFGIGALIFYCLYCFALIPLWRYCANDIQYMNTALPEVIEIIYDLVELAVISAAYAVSIYSVYNYGIGDTFITAGIFAAVTFFKYAINLVMSWIDAGFDVDVASDAVSVLVPLCLELLQYFIVLLIANKIISRYKDSVKLRLAAAKRLGAQVEISKPYPFATLVEFKNPLLKSALAAGICIAVSKVGQRIVYDLFYSLMYGAPRLAEIPVMIVYYLSDVLTGVACYFIAVWLLMLFFETKFKRELYNE